MKCGIRSMPTFQMFRYGAKVCEFSGADEGRLRTLLTQHGGPPTAIAPGTRAVICGLKSKPELNGQAGKVGAFDAAKSRYVVEVASETLALKRDNLVQLCAATALATADSALPAGLAAGAPLEVTGFDLETGEYTVRPVGGGEPVQLPVGCVRLADEMSGFIMGLQVDFWWR